MLQRSIVLTGGQASSTFAGDTLAEACLLRAALTQCTGNIFAIPRLQLRRDPPRAEEECELSKPIAQPDLCP